MIVKDYFQLPKVTEQRKSRAEALIHSMSSHVKSWQEKLCVCLYHMETLVGDALLSAACVCYLGPLEQGKRQQLIHEWKTVCGGKMEEDDDNDDDNAINPRSFTNTSYNSTSFHIPVTHRLLFRSDFSLKTVLSNKEELYKWQSLSLPVNFHSVESALIMRAICDKASKHWPLLVDTDLQSYAWVKCFHGDKDHKCKKLYL